MKRLPFLILGTMIGIIVAANSFTGYDHGTENEAWSLLRILYGAAIGLIVGIVAELVFAIRRRH